MTSISKKITECPVGRIAHATSLDEDAEIRLAELVADIVGDALKNKTLVMVHVRLSVEVSELVEKNEKQGEMF